MQRIVASRTPKSELEAEQFTPFMSPPINRERPTVTRRVKGYEGFLTGYQRERRARRRLEKWPPELLSLAREAESQLRSVVQGIGGLTKHPKCCASVHWAASSVWMRLSQGEGLVGITANRLVSRNCYKRVSLFADQR